MSTTANTRRPTAPRPAVTLEDQGMAGTGPQHWNLPLSRWVTGTRPDQDGRFRVRNMPPGSYNIIAVDYVEARDRKIAFWDTVRPLFERYELLLTPSVSVPAFEVGRLNPAHFPQHEWDWFDWASFSYPFNFTGQPAASVPAGFTAAGLPVGLQIVGRRCADLDVLQASAAFEAARPWADRRPPV